MDIKSLLDAYLDYQKKRTDADQKYATILFLQALGHAIGKKSVNTVNPSKEYHNLYVLLVGDSFFGRKTVSQEIGMKLYPIDNVLPNEWSPEQFIQELSITPKGVVQLGEFSKILKLCKSGKGYLAPIIEIWNDLYRYERPTYIRTTKNNGQTIVEEPYLCINSTCTEEVLKKYAEVEMLSGGFFGRFLIVYGKTERKPRRELPPEVDDLERFFQEYFVALNVYFRDHPVIFKFTHRAYDLLNQYEEEFYKETKISAIAGRYGQTMISLADLFALEREISIISNISEISNISKISKLRMEGQKTELTNITNITNFTNLPNFVNVDIEDLERAYNFVKPCIDYVRNLKDYCESEPHVAKLRDFMLKNRITQRSKYMRLCNETKESVDKAEETLNETDLNIITIEEKGKKKMKCYCWRPYNTKERCKRCKIREWCKEVIA